MRVLVIADPKIPVPPRDYGGVERIIGYLCKEFQRLGHQVDLIAAEGSACYGGNLYTHTRPGSSISSRFFRKASFSCLLFKALRQTDIVLNFGRLDYLEVAFLSKKPVVCCFQNPISQSEPNWVLSRRRTSNAFIGISHSQIATLQSSQFFSVVHNCTDTEQFQFCAIPSAAPYLAFLGRLTANKGVDTAIRVARRCGLKLKLAGNISDETGGREFFEKEIRPQLDDQIEWIGPVDDAAKKVLLSGARALLFPIRWAEPFGIVMAEALACGTPVIATRCASTPEVIDHGVNGFLCDTEEELVDAVNHLDQLDRAACRRSAETRFSVPVMAGGYLKVLESLSSGTKQSAPRHISRLGVKRILVIVDAKLPVPPRTYGGAERIAAYLCAEFQKAGHHVTLMAGPGSQSFGGRLILHQPPSQNIISRGLRKLWFQWLSRRAARGSDIILNFGRIDYLGSILRTAKPVLCRFGNPVVQSELDWVLARHSINLRFIGISNHQVSGLKPENLIAVLHNGSDVERFKFRNSNEDEPYLIFVGRLTANKGVDIAIQVARRSGMKLKLGGNISDERGDLEYFERFVKPNLDSQIEWVGEVEDDTKQVLIGNAIALLFPIRWPEPFGIVMAESLACGTPVIAMRCASTPEVVEHEITGFLCDSEDEMVAAVARVRMIDRAVCRHAAETKFSVEVMAQGYLRVMDQLLEESTDQSN